MIWSSFFCVPNVCRYKRFSCTCAAARCHASPRSLSRASGRAQNPHDAVPQGETQGGETREDDCVSKRTSECHCSLRRWCVHHLARMQRAVFRGLMSSPYRWGSHVRFVLMLYGATLLTGVLPATVLSLLTLQTFPASSLAEPRGSSYSKFARLSHDLFQDDIVTAQITTVAGLCSILIPICPLIQCLLCSLIGKNAAADWSWRRSFPWYFVFHTLLAVGGVSLACTDNAVARAHWLHFMPVFCGTITLLVGHVLHPVSQDVPSGGASISHCGAVHVHEGRSAHKNTRVHTKSCRPHMHAQNV